MADDTIVQKIVVTAEDQASAPLNKLAATVTSTGQAIQQVGERTAVTRQEVRALGRILAEAGLAEVGGFASSVFRVATALGELGTAMLVVLAAGAALVKFTKDAIATADALDRLSQISGGSFQGLARIQAGFDKAGVSAKDFRDAWTSAIAKITEEAPKIGNAIADSTKNVSDAELALAKAKAAAHPSDATYRAIVREKEERQKLLAVKEADRKLDEAIANELDRVISKYEAMARGVKQALDPLTTLKTQTQALIATLAKTDGSIEQMTLKLARMADTMTGLQRLNFGKVLKDLGLSQDIIDQILKGSEAIKKLEDAGRSLSQKQTADLKDLEKAWKDFTASAGFSMTQLAADLAPKWIEILAAAKQSVADLVNLPIAQNLWHALQGVGYVLKAVFVDSWIAIGKQALDAVTTLGGQIVTGWGLIFNRIKQGLIDAFEYATAPIQAALDKISGWLDYLMQKAKALWGAITGATAAPASAPDAGGLPMASGGLVWGKGGIDTNLAWLTSGEYVVRAAAVRAIGLRALDAINAGFAPRFASGGLNMGPRLATVSATAAGSSQRTLHLTIEGRSFSGLSIPETTAQSLERFAVHSQIASAGRKQSWRR